MDQRSFDFSHDEPHALYLQLDTAQQQVLVEQMSQLIITVFKTQEKTVHASLQQPKQD